MPIPGMDVHYLRFVLHDDTDGILTAKKRENGSASDIPQADEIRDLLQLMAARGACKIRLTGDDPARRSDLCEVISLVSDIPGVAEIAMTTGGGALAGRVRDFARAGLRSINFDLDTLKAERYVQITGRDELPQVRAAMQEALDLGLRVKVNCMLQTGLNVDEIDAFVALTKDQLIEVRFIEWNTAADRIAPPEAFVPTTEAMARIKPPLVHREPEPFAGPALRFEIPGHLGGIGFVANMTEHFCGDCTRLSLTDHGEIASCVFGRGVNVLKLLRSPGALESVDAYVDRVLRRKNSIAARLNGWETPTAAAVAPSLP